MLTLSEVDCLYQLGQINHCEGVIVEIGSWKGQSTIALALAIVDNLTVVRKVRNVSPIPRFREACYPRRSRVYIAARKSRVPDSKPFGRWLLKNSPLNLAYH
jgi:hypothetical protein